MSKYFQLHLIKQLLLLFCLFFINRANAQVQASFSADITEGCGAISQVRFTDLSTGNITSWLWDFGNGNTSILQNPSASYPTTGQFTVSLTVSDGSNSDSEVKTNYIKVFRNPTANFNQSPTSGCPPLSVQFNSTSTIGDAPISQYIWDFGDGSQPATSSNPNHKYLNSGNFPVSLQIFDQNNCSDNKIFNAIQVTAAPIASFSTVGARFACSPPFQVTFSNQSTGANNSYLWQFGDGASSTLANPSHTYTSFGSYTVSLIARNSNCSDTSIIIDYININPAMADFTSPDSICFGEPYSPVNTSTGGIQYYWEFGDGGSSILMSPSHTYADSGMFTVKLTTSSGPGCFDSKIDSIYIQKVIPQFTSSKNYTCQPGDTIYYNASSINGSQYKWKFQTSNGVDSVIGQNVFHQENFEGYFADTLIVTSTLGCQEMITIDSNRHVEFLHISVGANTNQGCAPYSTLVYYSVSGPGPLTQWKWNFGNGDTSLLEFPGLVNIDTAGGYPLTLWGSNALGCTAMSDPKILMAGNPQIPIIQVSADSICSSDSLVILNFSTDTAFIDLYKFTIGNADTTINQAVDTFGNAIYRTFPDTGFYFVSLRINDRGCFTDTVLDSAFYLHGPIIEPSYSVSCNDILDVKFKGLIRGATRFYWDFGDGSPLDSINQDPQHTYSQYGNYTASIIAYNDQNNCLPQADTFDLFLQAISPPVMVNPKRDYCLYDTAKITFSPLLGFGSPNWQINGVRVSDSIVLVDTLLTIGQKSILLTVYDSLGCSHQIFDTIKTNQPSVNFYADTNIGCTPFSVQFYDSSFSDTSLVNWKWKFGNSDSSFIANPSARYILPGDYDVLLSVTDAFGCTDTIIKPNYISSPLIVPAFSNTSRFICQGGSVKFRNDTKGSGLNYAWDFGDGTTGSTSTHPTHVFSQAGYFSVGLTVTDSLGCDSTLIKPQLVNVSISPVADFVSDTSIASCYPLAVNFTDSSKGNPISWKWDFGDLSSSTLQNPFHNYTLPGKYDVSLIVSNGISCSDTIVKSAYIQTSGPIADFTMSKEKICINEAVVFTLINASNAYSYTWDFGDGNSTTGSPVSHVYRTTGILYPTLILRDSSGLCTISIRDTLEIEEVKADFTLSDTLGCGLPSQINFTNTSIGASQFKWTIAGSNYFIPNPSITFNQTGIFEAQLSINSIIGCTDTARKKIVIANKPIPTLSPDTGLCFGDSIILTGGGGDFYRWKPLINLNLLGPNVVRVFPDTTRTYTLITSNLEGCSDSLSSTIEVIQPPLPVYLFDTTLIIGEDIAYQFFAGTQYQYLWTPPEGISCTNCNYPTFNPLVSTQYFLNISDDYNCFNYRDSLWIYIKEAYTLDVPQAFSPNGDQKNDVLFARGWGIKNLLSFKIYNRLGEVVFESGDINFGWDGTYKGKPQPVETYVFTVEAETYNAQILRKKGTIMLIR